ncbi:MAG: RHS repeat-associated core domain-containing protein [Bdellovibrionales bacterium]
MPNVADYGSRDGYMPIGVLKDGELYFVACGLQGEPRYIVDGTNKPVWRWRHDAFGRGAPDQRPSGSSKDFVYNNRFPGQTYDAETGFFYNLNRYYDPATGRYTRPDPIGLAGGMNPYAYVGGNPATNVDPSGLIEFTPSQQEWILKNPVLKYTADNPEVGYYMAAAGAGLVTCGVAADITAVRSGILFGTRYAGNRPILNSASSLRVGWSKLGDEYTFRIGGKLIEKIKPQDPHITLWPPKYWFTSPKP